MAKVRPKTKKKTTKKARTPVSPSKAAVPEKTRQTYVFDHETLGDAAFIQRVLRASTATHAAKYAIRRVAEMLRYVDEGGQIQVGFKGNRKTVILDFPRSDGKTV